MSKWECEFCNIEFKNKSLLNKHGTFSECSHGFYNKYRLQALFPWNNLKGSSNCIDCGIIIPSVSSRCKKCNNKKTANSEYFKLVSSETKKGDKHWLRKEGSTHPTKGTTYIEVHGRTKAKELKERLSELGKELTGQRNPFFGKTHTEENKETFRQNRLGKTYTEIFGKELAEQIIQGKLKPPQERKHYYTHDFFCQKLREIVIQDQNSVCAICHRELFQYFKNLHHIDYNKQNNIRQNLIYLCTSCHSRTNKKTEREYWTRELSKLNVEFITY